MPPITPAIATELANGARDALDLAGTVLTGGQAEFIRSGEPSSVYGKIQQETARQACRRYGDNPSQFTGVPAVLVENACRPYLDDIGYPNGPSIALPFTGGQCQGVQYAVTTRLNLYPFADCSVLAGGPSTVTVPGPIIGPVFKVENPTNPLCTPGRNVVYLRYGNPVQEILLGGTGRGVDLVSFSVAPVTVGTDVCGDPLPEIEPPPPSPTPLPPGPVRYNPQPDIDINIDVTVNPDLSFDVDFGTGPITIDPFGDGGGGGDPGGGGPGDPVPPGFQGEPGDPIDVTDEEPADETDPDRNLLGVLVETIESPPRANKVFNRTEGYTKGAYFVYFGGDAGLSLNPEGAITLEDQFFYAPEGANRFRVVPNVGFTIRVTPYYREEE